MARVLILYGTTDGHTRKIATAMAGVLTGEGCRVDVVDAKGVAPGVRPEDYNGVVVAGSIHAGGYQRAVTRWVRRHAAALKSATGSVRVGVPRDSRAACRGAA